MKTATVLVNWNNCEDTIKCIESLRRSTVPCHIVVVDNGSRESDVRQLEAIEGIMLIANPANFGFGQGCNIGMQWIIDNYASEYIFILNNDAVINIDVIEILEDALERHDAAGAVTARILTSHSHAVWYGGGEISWLTGGARIAGIWGPQDAGPVMVERNVTFASGCALFIRRTVLEEIGMFDPRLFMYEEDVDLCLRIIKAGWKIRYIPSAVVLHDEQGSQRKKHEKEYSIQDPRNPRLAFYMYHRIRNKLLVFTSHAHGLQLIQFWLGFPAYWSAKCIQFAMHGRWDAVRSVVRAIQAFCLVKIGARSPFDNNHSNDSNSRKSSLG